MRLPHCAAGRHQTVEGAAGGQYLALKAVTTFFRKTNLINWRRFSEVLGRHHGPFMH